MHADVLAELLLLSPPLHRHISSLGAGPQLVAPHPQATALLGALVAAAEALTSGAVAGTDVPMAAWERLVAAADMELGQQLPGSCTAWDSQQLQQLAVSLHNAAATLGGARSCSEDGNTADAVARAWQAVRLLEAAFNCSVLRWRPVLAAATLDEDSSTAAVEELGKRAKACLSGLVRCAGRGGGNKEGDTSPALAGGRVMQQLVAALGPRLAMQQQRILQGLMRLHLKLSLATEGPVLAAGTRGSSKAKPTSGTIGPGRGSCTSFILASSDRNAMADGAAAASEIADVLAFTEACCIAQLEARGGTISAARLEEFTRQAVAAAASCAPPSGWSQGEWDAQACLLATLCGVADAGDSALDAASDALACTTSHTAATTASKRGAQASGRRPRQQSEDDDGGSAGPKEVVAAKLEAAAICRCLAALHGAHSASETAAAAAAAESAVALSTGEARESNRQKSSGEAPSSSASGAGPSRSSSGRSSGSSSSSISRSRGAGAAGGKRSSKSRSGATAEMEQGVWTASAATAWHGVRHGLEEAADLWQSAADYAGPGGAACMLRLPAASVQALLQAWHIAALQNWQPLQQRLARAACWLLPHLPREEADQLAPVLVHLPQGSWLAHLLQPAAAVTTVAATLSLDDCSGSDSGSGSGSGEGEDTGGGERDEGWQERSCRRLQAKAEELEAASDSSDSWARLRVASLYLAATQAAQVCGDLPEACLSAERALVLSSHVHAASAAGGGNGGAAVGGSAEHTADAMDVGRRDQSPPPTPQPPQQQQQQAAAAPPVPRPTSARSRSRCAAGDDLLQWQSLGIYMSSLVQLGIAHEAAGCPEEAIRMLREAAALAAAARCAALAAAARAWMACVWSKRGDSARAAAQLQLAQAAYAVLQAEAGGDDGSGGESVAVAKAVGALVACAAGDVARVTGDHGAARESYSAAAQPLEGSVAAANPCDGAGALAYWSCCIWANAQLGLAACEATAQDDPTTAVERLRYAAEALSAEAAPVPAAALRLELLRLRAQQALAARGPALDAPRCPHLVGFGGASAHSNLLEEFAHCMLDADGGTDGVARGKAHKPAARKAAGAARAPGSKGTSESSGLTKAGGPGALLMPLLQLLWPSRHLPRLFKRACTLLARVCELEGAPYACAMFLQLSIGEWAAWGAAPGLGR
jgi:tetratricopeptide (TPR) repeat protein